VEMQAFFLSGKSGAAASLSDSEDRRPLRRMKLLRMKSEFL